MVPLNLTYLHYLQHSLFEHLFNLYYINCNYFINDIFNLLVYFLVIINIFIVHGYAGYQCMKVVNYLCEVTIETQ